MKSILPVLLLSSLSNAYFVKEGEKRPNIHYHSDHLPTKFIKSTTQAEPKHYQVFGQNCGLPSNYTVHPWNAIVQIEIYNEGFNYCGGTILSINWVVTAGSCLISPARQTACYKRGRPVRDCIGSLRGKVIYGIEDFNSDELMNIHPSHVSAITNFHMQESYGKWLRNKNDIAVIKVTDINFNNFISPICLPTHDYCIRSGFELDATGLNTRSYWKSAKNGKKNIQTKRTTLDTVKVPIWEPSDCKIALSFGSENIGYSQKTMVCARNIEDVGNNCVNNDDGSPLVHHNGEVATLYGISSLSWHCNDPQMADTPGFYTRITNYLDWIQKMTGVIADDAPYMKRGPNNNGKNYCDDSHHHEGTRQFGETVEDMRKRLAADNSPKNRQNAEIMVRSFGSQNSGDLNFSLVSKKEYKKETEKNFRLETFHINQKYPLAGYEILSFMINSLPLSKLINHGCWCTKLDSVHNHKDNSGGHHAVDELDTICRNWANARQCNGLKDGSCEKGKFSSFRYYINELDEKKIECAGQRNKKLGRCLEDSCEIDMYFGEMVKRYVARRGVQVIDVHEIGYNCMSGQYDTTTKPTTTTTSTTTTTTTLPTTTTSTEPFTTENVEALRGIMENLHQEVEPGFYLENDSSPIEQPDKPVKISTNTPEDEDIQHNYTSQDDFDHFLLNFGDNNVNGLLGMMGKNSDVTSPVVKMVLGVRCFCFFFDIFFIIYKISLNSEHLARQNHNL